MNSKKENYNGANKMQPLREERNMHVLIRLFS
jgi:hypothetical protein